jgi:hypothetical protein
LLITGASDQLELLLTAEDASLLACVFVAVSGMALILATFPAAEQEALVKLPFR